MWLWFTALVELTILVDIYAARMLTNLFHHTITHQLKIPWFLCNLRKIILQKYTGGSPQNIINVSGFTFRFQKTPIAMFKSTIEWQTTENFSLDCTEAAETRPISVPPELHMIHDRGLNTQEYFYQRQQSTVRLSFSKIETFNSPSNARTVQTDTLATGSRTVCKFVLQINSFFFFFSFGNISNKVKCWQKWIRCISYAKNVNLKAPFSHFLLITNFW